MENEYVWGLQVPAAWQHQIDNQSWWNKVIMLVFSDFHNVMNADALSKTIHK